MERSGAKAPPETPLAMPASAAQAAAEAVRKAALVTDVVYGVMDARDLSACLLAREGAEARLEAAAEPAPEPVPRPAERNPLPLRPRSELEAMGDEQRAIFALLSGRALVPDEIVGRTEIPARRVNTALTLLQAQGYLNELPGKRFTAAVRFDD